MIVEKLADRLLDASNLASPELRKLYEPLQKEVSVMQRNDKRFGCQRCVRVWPSCSGTPLGVQLG